MGRTADEAGVLRLAALTLGAAQVQLGALHIRRLCADGHAAARDAHPVAARAGLWYQGATRMACQHCDGKPQTSISEVTAAERDRYITSWCTGEPWPRLISLSAALAERQLGDALDSKALLQHQCLLA